MLIPHVPSVKNKVLKVMGTEVHKGPLLFKVLDQVVNDAAAGETSDAFNECSKAFI